MVKINDNYESIKEINTMQAKKFWEKCIMTIVGTAAIGLAGGFMLRHEQSTSVPRVIAT